MGTESNGEKWKCVDCDGPPTLWPVEVERAVLRQLLVAAADQPGTDVASAAWGAAKVLNDLRDIGVSNALMEYVKAVDPFFKTWASEAADRSAGAPMTGLSPWGTNDR